jgi:hypothetical protein
MGMQEFSLSVRLFSRSYSVRSRLEGLLLLLALLSVAIHGWLLYHLIAVKDLHSAMTFLYLFSLLPFSLFLGSVWLDRNPGYQRHLTLLPSGVRYRRGFMQREYDFDWEEIETISLQRRQLTFELKNGEEHTISLESVQREHTLQQIAARLTAEASSREIELHVSDK